MLIVWECELRTIELGAFIELTKLTELFLSYTDINEIIPGTFENTGNLENLDLQSNRIEHFNRDMFSGLDKRNK